MDSKPFKKSLLLSLKFNRKLDSAEEPALSENDDESTKQNDRQDSFQFPILSAFQNSVYDSQNDLSTAEPVKETKETTKEILNLSMLTDAQSNTQMVQSFVSAHNLPPSVSSVGKKPTDKTSILKQAPNHRIQKELKLRDFEVYERISQVELDSIELHYLKKLYMIQPRNSRCLLYRLQKKQNSNFDGTEYTALMRHIFEDTYKLPFLERRYDSKERVLNNSVQPYDELFIWSLLLFSGNMNKDLKLPRYFWSKCKYPMASALVGIITYKKLLDEGFLPDDLKEKMKTAIKELERLAILVAEKCSESSIMVTQDLYICQIDLFYRNTILELANKAEVLDFVSVSSFQQLLNDVWYDRIEPQLGRLIMLPYFLTPLSLLLPVCFFRSDNVELANLTDITEKSSRTNLKNSVHPTEDVEKQEGAIEGEVSIPNEDLSFRDVHVKLRGIYRILSYFNAPIIKFFNHLIFYILFLIMFTLFLLFDYQPETNVQSTVIRIPIQGKPDFIKVTITELLIIIFVGIYLIDEVREMLIAKTFDGRFITKFKKYYENKWNIFDTFIFVIYYLTLLIRFSPVIGQIFRINGESCYEIARTLYGINLILWYIRILQMISCVPFWGPKIIIIKAMVQKLVVYVALILIFLIPFATTVESIMNKTQNFSLGVMTNAINRVFWIIFGELLDMITEIKKFQCYSTGQSQGSDDTVCGHTFSSLVLLVGMAFFTITCHLLIFNMIIAVFTSTVDSIESDSNKIFRFHRIDGIRYFVERSLIPPPFVLIEHLFFTLVFIKNYLGGDKKKDSEKINSFHIPYLDDRSRNVYVEFEQSHLRKVWLEELDKQHHI